MTLECQPQQDRSRLGLFRPARGIDLPTYEYHCPKCKSTYDLRQGFDAETTHACENCGKGVAKRVLHAPKVLFKGSGFYVTDSKSKSSVAVTDSAPANSESSAGGESSTGPESKSPPKPDSKPEKVATPAKASSKSESATS